MKYDVVIIGSGAAGLTTALGIDDNLEVLVLTKTGIDVTNSKLAQGGIAATMSTDEADIKSHIKDTLVAGAGGCDVNAVEYLIRNSRSAVNFLVDQGVKFDMDGDNFSMTREAAHSQFRILHAGGDRTGERIEAGLIEAATRKPNITIFTECEVFEVKKVKYHTFDVIFSNYGMTKSIMTENLVIASGGYANLFNSTSNNVNSNGNGLELAYQVGAEVSNLAYIQFHPTVFAAPDGERKLLITEALRGEGARIWSESNGYFMENYHELADIAPRDIATRAVLSEMVANELEHVYLDCRLAGDSNFLTERFVTVGTNLEKAGIDFTREMVPIRPAAHYSIGGIKTNLNGETNVPGLFACGEVASTGVHGANRLASNSLLECVVFGLAVAKTIKPGEKYQVEEPEINCDQISQYLQSRVKQVISKHCNVVRTTSGLEQARDQVGMLIASNKREAKFINLANAIITDCLEKDSMGCHYKEER